METTENSNISSCRMSEKKCTDFQPHMYTSTISTLNDAFISTLVIKNISYKKHHLTFKCSLYGQSAAVRNIVQEWNLSKVFHKPDSLRCSAVEVGVMSINVSCYTPKVYPGIICQMFQTHDRFHVYILDSEKVMYYHKTSSASRYISASCSTIVTIRKAGIYKYYVTAFAGYGFTDKSSRLTQAETNEVNITRRPQLVIERGTQNLCIDQDNPQIFWCTAYWITQPNRFEWSFSNVSKEVVKVQPSYSSENYHRSVAEVRGSTTNVTCLMYYKENGIKKSLNNSLNLNNQYTPPKFKLNGKTIRTNFWGVKNEEKAGKFVCETDGGTPSVTSIHVKCHGSNQSDILTDLHTDSNSLPFTINYSKVHEKCTCLCTVPHQCFNLTANFSFYILSSRQEGDAGEIIAVPTYILYYIIAGTIGVILVIVILGILLFLCNRWRDLYSYIYVYLSTISSQMILPRDNHHYEQVSNCASSRSNQSHQLVGGNNGTISTGQASVHKDLTTLDYSRGWYSMENVYSAPHGINTNTTISDLGFQELRQINHIRPFDRRVRLENESEDYIGPQGDRPSPVGCDGNHSPEMLQDSPFAPLENCLTPPPPPCKVNKHENECLLQVNSRRTSSNSSRSRKSYKNTRFQLNQLVETSTSENSLSARSSGSLPSKTDISDTKQDDDMLFVPIFHPRNEVFPTATSHTNNVGDYTNLQQQAYLPHKAATQSTRRYHARRKKVRMNNAKQKNTSGAYLNVQSSASQLHEPPLRYLETTSLSQEGIRKHRRSIHSSFNGELTHSVPKRSSREPLMGSGHNFS